MDPISEVIWPYMLTLAVGFVLVSYIRKRMRSASLNSTAKELGFGFSAPGRDTTRSLHRSFELFTRGQQGKLSNELWKSLDGNEFRIFSYSYRENGGNNNARNQTVLSIRSDQLDAPVLSLQPKLKRLMMVPDFGQYESGFRLPSALSQNYVLKGEDEATVCEFFKPGMIVFFEANPDFRMEAQGDTLILYTSKRRLVSSGVKPLYDEGRNILSELIA